MTHTLKRTTLKSRQYALLALGLALLAASILFIPFIALNNGVFYYYGDFNVQEIPFYQIGRAHV